MAESHLVYKLEGDIKEIDVFKLAPTLLAVSIPRQSRGNSHFIRRADSRKQSGAVPGGARCWRKC
jgi:hypothetical protein